MLLVDGQTIGKCEACGRKLLLNDDGLCIHCEKGALQEKVDQLELTVSLLRREKSNLYNMLIKERMKSMEKRP